MTEHLEIYQLEKSGGLEVNVGPFDFKPAFSKASLNVLSFVTFVVPQAPYQVIE